MTLPYFEVTVLENGFPVKLTESLRVSLALLRESWNYIFK
jgi:hypothetical protein